MTDAAPQIRFTPTQLRIVQLLADGEAHSREEIQKVLWDDQADVAAVRVHICHIRKTLRLMRQDIVCELNGAVKYRRVKYLDPDPTT